MVDYTPVYYNCYHTLQTALQLVIYPLDYNKTFFYSELLRIDSDTEESLVNQVYADTKKVNGILDDFLVKRPGAFHPVDVAMVKALKEHNLTPMARIHHLSLLGHDPVIMLEEPLFATDRALKRAGLNIGDIDLYEVNEAFACVAMFAMQDIGIAHDKINVHGGATALGFGVRTRIPPISLPFSTSGGISSVTAAP